METFSKVLGPAEVRRPTVCVPCDSRKMFPPIGGRLVVKDETSGREYEVYVGSQYRLVMPTWFADHPELRPGHEITFKRNNGSLTVAVQKAKGIEPSRALSRSGGLSDIGKKVVGLVCDKLADIESGKVPARVVVGDNSITLEWGQAIKATEITLRNQRVSG